MNQIATRNDARESARHARGRDVDVVLVVPLERVVTGGEETVTVERNSTCASCGGSGARAGSAGRRCEDCDGTGQQATSGRHGANALQQLSPCARCGGRGTVVDEPCPACGGVGHLRSGEEIKVRVPRGVEEGTALRIPRRGMPAPDDEGAPGDLYVVVETAEDDRFVRRGADLWHTTRVDVADAVLGTKRRVPTLGGEVAVRVPAGTQPGTVLCLTGKGLPRSEGRGRGDLYVTVEVSIPTELAVGDRRLWQRLRPAPPAGP